MLNGRYLHTMIHVADLERSIDFYTRVLGMQLLRRGEMPDEGRSNAFVGYGSEAETAAVELTAYRDRTRYDHGDGFGHLAIEFTDVAAACAAMEAAGAEILQRPFRIPSGKTIAFVADPDGYRIELVQPAS